MRRALAVLVPLVVLLALAGPASAASIWTPVASGTTQDISAVEYRSDAQAWFGTTSGRIFRASGSTFADAGGPGPGFQITDIAFNPAGTIGLATTQQGGLWRSADGGATWAAVLLGSLGRASCSLGAPASTVPPLYAVSWSADGSRAFAVGGATGGGSAPVVLRSNGGGSTWTNVNVPTAAGCPVSNPNEPITDVYVQPGNPDALTFITRYFGSIYRTTDGLATPSTKTWEVINGTGGAPRLAVDPVNPNRLWSADHSSGGSSLYFQFSEDGGATSTPLDIAGTATVYPNLYGIAYSGGSLLAVGDGGQLLSSIDGKTAFLQAADGALATASWRAVSLADTAHALVGGTGGALIKTAAANTIPDIVPPAGTISGSETPTVGAATPYTLNATDDAGGSGVDPASITWSADGAPGATGNPASITFTGAGYHTITASFRDRAGNAATAVYSVNAQAPIPVFVPPVVPPKAKTEKTTGVSVPGGTITLGTPVKCVPKNGSFTVRLSLKRRNAKGVIVTKIYRANFYVDNKLKKVDKKPTFTQKITVKKLKAGSKHTVKAKAYVRLSNKRSKTKSISTSFSVCK